MEPRRSLLLLLLLGATACGDSSAPLDLGAAPTADAGVSALDLGASTPDLGLERPDAEPGADSGDAELPDAGIAPSDAASPDATPISADPVALLPADGAELLSSAALRIAPIAGVARVVVTASVAGSSCEAAAPYFECLLDLSGAAPGLVPLRLVSYDGAGAELGRSTMRLVRREVPSPCAGTAAELDQCVVDRAAAGLAAGFGGVSYLNADDAHANVNTSRMVGIDARVLPEPPAAVPTDVALGLMNESTAWSLPDGRCSLARCNPSSRRRRALLHYDAGVLFLFPEHRDVGFRDYYQWQAPFFLMSQGSSSSERDEVTKGLRALGIMTADARQAAKQAGLIGPLLSLLLTRSREASDVAFLRPEAHPTALTNTSNDEAILALAAALRADELPPVGRLTVVPTFPAHWSMIAELQSPYAQGFTPVSTTTITPSGRFSLDVDLSTSTDANARPLLFVPVVLRGEADVSVQRVGPDRYEVTGDFPRDVQLLTGGHERTVSRVTVAFFPHNGLWLGTPAMVSVGGRRADEAAPNSNDLD